MLVGDKTLDERAVQTTGQLFTRFETPEPAYLDIDLAKTSGKELPSLNIFSEAKSLIEIDNKTAIIFDGLENLENVWEGTGVLNTKSAQRKELPRKIISRRPKAKDENEKVTDISFRKTPNNSAKKSKGFSGREKASYQTSPKKPRSSKPLFNLSKANSLSFLP